MKEFRLTAFAQKNNDVVCDFPNIFSFKTFLIPPSRTSISRKKKAQTQMGNDSQSKKSQRIKDQTKTKVLKKGLNLAEE